MNGGSIFTGLGRVLIISSVEKGTAFLSEMLADFYPETTVTVADGASARRLYGDGCAFDYVFINLPLRDETGVELAERIIADAPASAIMALLRGELADSVGARLSEHGIFTLAKPIVRANFVSGVRLMIAAQAHLRALEDEIARLRAKLEEQSLIARAKLVLVQSRGMTEGEAHRHIEKIAMDSRRKRREVAVQILSDYWEYYGELL